MTSRPWSHVDGSAQLTLTEQVDAIQRRRLGCVENVLAHLARIDRYNPELGAFVELLGERALAAARRRDSNPRRWTHQPLIGATFGVKGNIAVRGLDENLGTIARITVGPAPRDAPVVERLRRAGAIVLGRTNLHELAAGMTTVNPRYGMTRNPWNPEYIPGGSSGGSAAAVAAALTSAALGTDTGGSIRIPAALCGVVGMKPSFGNVSCIGVQPLATSLDHVGPITRTVADCALVMAVIDSSSSREQSASYRAAVGKSVRGLKVGLVDFSPGVPISPGSDAALQAAREALGDAGCRLRTVEFPRLADVVEAQRTISYFETAEEYGALLDDRGQELGSKVIQRLRRGRLISRRRYAKAKAWQREIQGELAQLFNSVDGLLSPATASAAVPIGAQRADIRGHALDLRSLYLRFSAPYNLSGTPSIVVPIALDAHGLPVGVQIASARSRETTALSLAAVVEREVRFPALT